MVRCMGSDTRTQMLSAQGLVEAATSATGLDDFGDDDWREGFERLVQALVHEAALNESGSIAAFKELKSPRS
jgi:soluble cytochrome b562